MTGKQLFDVINTFNTECKNDNVKDATVYVYNTFGQCILVFDDQAKCTIRVDTNTLIVCKSLADFDGSFSSIKHIDIDAIGFVELEIIKKD